MGRVGRPPKGPSNRAIEVSSPPPSSTPHPLRVRRPRAARAMNAPMRSALRAQRMLCDFGDCVVNGIYDVAGSVRAALIYIMKNLLQPGFDNGPSSEAVALPERGDLFVGRNAAPQRLVECDFLIIAQNIHARPTRFDFARHVGEFALISLRPVRNPAQNLFGSPGHEQIALRRRTQDGLSESETHLGSCRTAPTMDFASAQPILRRALVILAAASRPLVGDAEIGFEDNAVGAQGCARGLVHDGAAFENRRMIGHA